MKLTKILSPKMAPTGFPVGHLRERPKHKWAVEINHLSAGNPSGARQWGKAGTVRALPLLETYDRSCQSNPYQNNPHLSLRASWLSADQGMELHGLHK